MMKENTSIQVEELVKRFGAFTAVNQISFRIHAGEIFGLLGPNGGGKTTLFKILSTLMPASGGSATVFGDSLQRVG